LFIALIVAAGTGERMNSIIPKQFLPVLGKPVLAYTIDAFEKSPLIDEIIVVINENHEKQFQEQILNHIQTKKIAIFFFLEISINRELKSRMREIFPGMASNSSKDKFCMESIIIREGARFSILDSISL
jgi:2-C-methyl-D-erythritol 4-phosphate cytidylyltransferase